MEQSDTVFRAEPKENDYVKIRFRAGRENIDQVFLITNDVRQKMEKISNDRLFDYYEAGMQLDTQRVEYYFEVHCGPLVCYYNATGVADHVDHSIIFGQAGIFYSFMGKRSCFLPDLCGSFFQWRYL